jgi:hypothetical protein
MTLQLMAKTLTPIGLCITNLTAKPLPNINRPVWVAKITMAVCLAVTYWFVAFIPTAGKMANVLIGKAMYRADLNTSADFLESPT